MKMSMSMMLKLRNGQDTQELKTIIDALNKCGGDKYDLDVDTNGPLLSSRTQEGRDW
jgi:hypothetical protein